MHTDIDIDIAWRAALIFALIKKYVYVGFAGHVLLPTGSGSYF